MSRERASVMKLNLTGIDPSTPLGVQLLRFESHLLCFHVIPGLGEGLTRNTGALSLLVLRSCLVSQLAGLLP